MSKEQALAAVSRVGVPHLPGMARTAVLVSPPGHWGVSPATAASCLPATIWWATLLNDMQTGDKSIILMGLFLMIPGFYFWELWADLMPQRLKLLLPFGKLWWKIISHLQEKTAVTQHSRHWLSSFQQTPLNHTAHHLKQTLYKAL